MEYIIINSYDKNNFIRQVNEKIIDGYNLVGGASYSPNYGFFQAMVLNKMI